MHVHFSQFLIDYTVWQLYAHQLLQHFVSKCAELYGREFLVYNVQTLAHIAREAQHFGDLDSGASEI